MGVHNMNYFIIVNWTGSDWRSARLSDSGYMVFEFEWRHCFNSLTALGKLLTTNVHPLDPGVNAYLA